MTTPIQPAQIIPAGKFLVVRDDFLVGGTKEAALMLKKASRGALFWNVGA